MFGVGGVAHRELVILVPVVVKLDDSAYTSPNFFIAQAAEQMDAKVSPYLAFLTDMHAHIAAMEPPVVNTIQGWDRIPEGQR